MRIDLSQSDHGKLEKLIEIRQLNMDLLGILSQYLREHSCFIKKEMVDEIIHSCQVSEEYAYFVLLAAACGLDLEDSKRDLEIARRYLLRSIKKLDASTYKENPYYKNIRIPEAKFGSWELSYKTYQPYEAFIYNDIVLDKDFSEIPRLGFFDETFRFPTVLESGKEWMTITPNEIETMQAAVDDAHGRVITFGLGLGYFAYMASRKQQVQSVTIVEKDNAVNGLFREHILTQFPHKEKIELISGDAFEYVKSHMPQGSFDYAFVDLWHDVSDGVDLYLKMKKLEDLSPKTRWIYWIEESLLSNLRWYVYEAMLDGMKTNNFPLVTARDDPSESCPQGYIRKMKAVTSYFEGKCIRSFDEIAYYLSEEFLKKTFSGASPILSIAPETDDSGSAVAFRMRSR